MKSTVIVRPYSGAAGPGFLLVQGNAHPHVARVCRPFLDDEVRESKCQPLRKIRRPPPYKINIKGFQNTSQEFMTMHENINLYIRDLCQTIANSYFPSVPGQVHRLANKILIHMQSLVYITTTYISAISSANFSCFEYITKQNKKVYSG